MEPAEARARRGNAGNARIAVLTLVVAATSSWTGCQHADQPSASPTALSSASSPDRPNAAVPLPERTPFDDDPLLRAVFLEYYANGYVLAATNSEYASPGCLCEAAGDARRYDAMAEGFFAGRKAGTEASRARAAGARGAPSV